MFTLTVAFVDLVRFGKHVRLPSKRWPERARPGWYQGVSRLRFDVVQGPLGYDGGEPARTVLANSGCRSQYQVRVGVAVRVGQQ
jgi:hypothetical protein